MTTTKAEMITRICEKARLSKDDATIAIESTFEVMKAYLERGEPVKITGFGSFVIRSKRPRRGRNPQTGAEIVIPERKVLTFKPSPIMRKTVEAAQSE